MQHFKEGDLIRIKSENLTGHIVSYVSDNYLIEDMQGRFWWCSEDRLSLEDQLPPQRS